LEALDGRYGVQSRNDGKQGSLFWFEIPYRPDVSFATAVANNAALTTNSGGGGDLQLQLLPSHRHQTSFTSLVVPSSKNLLSSSSSARWNILVVDDSPAIVKMISMSLKRQGHQVEIAENGEIAVKKVLEKRKQQILLRQQQHTAAPLTVLFTVDAASTSMPEEEMKGSSKKQSSNKQDNELLPSSGFDLILMDLQMPIMDGFEATRRLRVMEKDNNVHESVLSVLPNQQQQLPRLSHYYFRIIGMSANSDNETVHEALASGMDYFIAKPFSIDSFNEIAWKCMQKLVDG